MSIYRRKETGIYYLKVKDGMGYKRVSLGTKNSNHAQALYQAYLAEKVKVKLFGLVTPPVPKHLKSITKDRSSLSFDKLHEKYLDTSKAQNITEYTIKRKIKTFQSLKDNGILSLSSINQDGVNKLLSHWSSFSTETQIRHIKNLKAFLNFAINQGLYSINLYKTLKYPVLHGNVRDITIPEKDYLLLLKTATDRDFTLYLQTLWETGCRPNEIVCLKKSDIDFDKGIAKIYQNKTKKYKIVYFTDELLKKIQALKTEYVFEGFDRQKEYYGKKFRDLKETLGLPKEYCLYAFRHSFATRMLNKTKDLHLVSKLLGHSDISITAKHYINRNPDEIRKQLIEAEGTDT